jgi:hypothetical protein
MVWGMHCAQWFHVKKRALKTFCTTRMLGPSVACGVGTGRRPVTVLLNVDTKQQIAGRVLFKSANYCIGCRRRSGFVEGC